MRSNYYAGYASPGCHDVLALARLKQQAACPKLRPQYLFEGFRELHGKKGRYGLLSNAMGP